MSSEEPILIPPTNATKGGDLNEHRGADTHSTNRAVRMAAWIIVELEGGEVNNPFDRGGHTKYGITESTAKDFGKTIAEVTFEDAQKILATEYWRFDSIQSDLLALKLFEISVHSGPKIAIKLLQRALRTLAKDVDEDGILGPETLSAVNSPKMSPEAIVGAVTMHQMIRFQELCNVRSANYTFLAGWMARAIKAVRYQTSIFSQKA